MRRIVFTLIATFSAFLLAATVAPAATAQQDTTLATDRTVAGTATERGLPLHDVRWQRAGETARDGVFFSRGKVVTYKGRVVKLQRAATRHGRYRTIKTDRTTASEGVWSVKFRGRIGTHWRILIPETNWARTTRVYIGRIVRD